MSKRTRRWGGLGLLLILAWLLAACQGVPSLSGGNEVVVSLVYGSEKEEWLAPLAERFNSEGHTLEDGTRIRIEATPMGSVEPIDAMLAGTLQPTVWSPASSIYLPVANAAWRAGHPDDLVTGQPADLVLSPVVIAMWQPMAEALGWPDKALGWADIAQLATSDAGWEAYGYPEWGAFKFGHTHPGHSNSGIVSVLAEAYSATGKTRDLTVDDLQRPEVRDFMAQVESTVIHYGTSTGFFAERMFERGPSYLSAAVLYENLVVAQENRRLAGQSQQPPLVAIYPNEGTFWANHPYVILNAPWVTEAQREAAEAFQRFLLDRPQQERAIQLGFRPADPAIPLGTPLDSAHGVDPAQPQTLLEVPPAEVIREVQALWETTKKPVDVVVVMDVSGSMRGDKIAAARTSLIDFVNLLSERDRLQVIAFSDSSTELSALSPVSEKREEVTRRVGGLIETGGTALYDATLEAYRAIQQGGNPDHIRAVVVLSDGEDSDSINTLEQVMVELGAGSEEGGNAIKLFTIAFGEDADTSVLEQLAQPTGGRLYLADPGSIRTIYADIETFF